MPNGCGPSNSAQPRATAAFSNGCAIRPVQVAAQPQRGQFGERLEVSTKSKAGSLGSLRSHRSVSAWLVYEFVDNDHNSILAYLLFLILD
jgi:hypothetical protein